jgi:GT2 family glycosyltransferase
VQPTVAIVILNWNGHKHLDQFLPSVLATTYFSVEIVVADNASTDDSIEFLNQQYPQIRIIHLDINHGFSKGYNQALRQVKADYYILLNSDVQVTAGWVEPVIDLMEKDKTIGACQPKILSQSDPERFEYAGAAGGWLDFLGYPLARGRIFDVCEKDLGQYDDPQPIFWASGAAMFVRAELYHSLGGLDEYFFAHQEEIDFCWRLQAAGHRIFVCPASVVYHLGGGTLPKGNERKVFLNFRNNLIMVAKNLPLYQAIWTIPFRIVLDIISAWKSLFSGQGIYFMAVLEAHAAFAKWILFNRKQSLFPQKKSVKPDGWLKRSVVWQHFILGKKTFKEIVDDKS